MSSTPRRTSGEIRNLHTQTGAFLFEFEERSWSDPMKGHAESPLCTPLLLEPKSVALNKNRQSWRGMERKGFSVTKDVGCLLPHLQYGKSITESGAKMNGCGYKTSMGFFTGLIGNHPSAPERDTDGRPISLEVSHLCHRSSCINPMHLVAEPKWCNLKRNYCGKNSGCNCGNTIKCLRMYQTSHTLEKPSLCTTKKEVLETLKELKGVHPFKILAKNAYDERDQKATQKRQTKAKNQKKRKRQADKQAHAAGKKAAKKAVDDQAAKKAYEDAVMKHLSPEHV